MRLELHDSEEGNTLFAGIKNIDFDYQAEMWVQETCDKHHASVVKWVLLDDEEIICVWERPEGSQKIPDITQRSSRFCGTWEKGPEEIEI